MNVSQISLTETQIVGYTFIVLWIVVIGIVIYFAKFKPKEEDRSMKGVSKEVVETLERKDDDFEYDDFDFTNTEFDPEASRANLERQRNRL